MGQHGFSAASSLLYHRFSPSAIVSVEPVTDDRLSASPDNPLTPRHLRTRELTTGGDPVQARTALLANAQVTLSTASATEDSPLYRNATGDELIFVHQGSAVLESVFGSLPVHAGDYVVVPASTTHRWVLVDDRCDLFVVEAAGHVGPPEKYLSPGGQFLEHAPYCERDVRVPEPADPVDGERVDVLVRNRAGLSRHVHARHPFDVVGWDGCVYPWAFSIHDFMPIVGAVHQPPPVHQTFAGPGFVVCSFVPRPYDFGPGAVKVPYHHANTDSDEVIFYAGGDFMSRARSGIGAGSISFHPAGFVHGPQPGSVERSVDRDRTDELAVMVDTFSPLGVTEAARAVSDPDYPWTWAAEK